MRPLWFGVLPSGLAQQIEQQGNADTDQIAEQGGQVVFR